MQAFACGGVADATVLEAGMVITIEPGMAYDSGGTRRVMVHEENIVSTEGEPELLTMRASQVMPVIQPGSE